MEVVAERVWGRVREKGKMVLFLCVRQVRVNEWGEGLQRGRK
jgi:hypothetical protein